MWNEYEHTYEERAEYFKKLILDLEKQNQELIEENYILQTKLIELQESISMHRNPEDAYREDFISEENKKIILDF